MRRWLGLLLIACLMGGCGVGDDVIDFFESGFADDDTSSGNTNAENLQGTWTLRINLEDVTLDDGDVNGANNLPIINDSIHDTWDVDSTLPGGFLSSLNASIDDATEVNIESNRFTFRLSSDEMIAVDAEARDFNTVRLTLNTISVDVTVTISNDGPEMTITDDLGQEGNFTFENANQRPAIDTYTLEITPTTFITTIRRDDSNEDEMTQTYTFNEDDEDITLQGETIDVDVMLTNSNDRLILLFSDGRRGEFDRQQ